MKKRVLSLLLCTAMTIGTLSGCGKEAGNDEGKTTEVLGNDAEDEMTEVKIWHDGDENIMQTIADCANEKLAEDNIKVTFEKKSGLTDQLQLYGNDESNGPDMYLYAHDSLGTFAEMGILAPITDVISEDVMADLLPMTVEAGNYKDTQYLMPVYYETLLFMYNKASLPLPGTCAPGSLQSTRSSSTPEAACGRSALCCVVPCTLKIWISGAPKAS